MKVAIICLVFQIIVALAGICHQRHAAKLYQDVCKDRDALRALCEGMAGSLKLVRSIIKEASNTGFNYKHGDWAERLYQSQANTYEALTAYEKHKAGE